MKNKRQFFDVLEIFKIGGYCPDTNYVFLGINIYILYIYIRIIILI